MVPVEKDAKEYFDLIMFMRTEKVFEGANWTFLSSVQKFIEDTGKISPRQKAVVNQIYMDWTK